MTEEQVVEQARLLKEGSSCECYLWARYTKGADIESLQAIVLDSWNLDDCVSFARYVKGADTVALHARVEEIRNKSKGNKVLKHTPSDSTESIIKAQEKQIGELEKRLADLVVFFESHPVIHHVQDNRCKEDEYERVRVQGEYLWNLFLVSTVVFTVLGSGIYLLLK